MSKPTAKVHVLDFSAKDITQALEELSRMDDAGKLSGFMFVVKVKNRKRPMVGAAGCCVDEPLMSIGAAGYMYGAVLDNVFYE
jgi:hypothetical protein